jgi:type II secretory pathway predicted ATPase ExeA
MAGLKTSIDTRQGLAVLVGESGAGKATILRELHKEYSNDNKAETLLLLDAHFDSTADFISALAELFGGIEREAGKSDNQYKESVKKFLFDHAVASKKSILILINTADRLPDFCLRTLEEFYKYHIDAHRLLQVILAGSKKIQKKLSAFHDLSTYVSKYHTVGPMSFSEAKEIIRYQISDEAQSKPDKTSFSLLAQWVIFRNAQGYPGRIKDLCQLIFMTIRLHNTNKADWYIAQMCAKMLLPAQANKLQRLQFAVIAVVLIITVVYGISMQSLQEKPGIIAPSMEKVAEQPATETPPSLTETSSQPAITTPAPSASTAEKEQLPDSAEQIAAEIQEEHPQESISSSEQAAIREEPVGETPAMEKETQEEYVEQGKAATAPVPEEEPKAPVLAGYPSAESTADTGSDYPSSLTGIEPTDILGEITVRERETVGDMIRKLYGPLSFNRKNTKAVLMINPSIDDLRRINIGDTIKFPAIPVVLTGDAENRYWLEFARFNDIADAYRFVRDHANTPPMLIIPEVNTEDPKQFTVLMQENFTEKVDAEKAKKLLIPAIFSEVTILNGLPEEKYYFAKADHLETPSEPTAAEIEQETAIALRPDAKKIPETTTTSPSAPPQPPVTAASERAPSDSFILGEITVRPGETLGDMIRKIYGPYSFNKTNTKAVLAVNPQVSNPNNISIGDTILYPFIPVGLPDNSEELWWLQLEMFDTVAEAYRFLRKHANTPPMLIIPTRNNSGLLQFAVILQEYFADEDSALKTKKMLTPAIFAQVDTLQGLDSKIYQYTRLETEN